jgi:hypothetical protein
MIINRWNACPFSIKISRKSAKSKTLLAKPWARAVPGQARANFSTLSGNGFPRAAMPDSPVMAGMMDGRLGGGGR